MIKILAILMLLPAFLYPQEQTFVLHNGISFNGTLQRLTGDSAEIKTTDHGILKFSLDKIYQPNEFLFEKRETKKFRFQAGLSVGLGATESGIIKNAGLETRLIYFPWKKSRSGFSVKSGYEAVHAYLPAVVIPVEFGFQRALLGKKKGQLHVHGNAGWGFAKVQNDQYSWSRQSAKGGSRFHIGLTWYPGFFKDASFYTGVNILFQNMTFTVDSDWEQNHVEQRIQRLNLTFGVFL